MQIRCRVLFLAAIAVAIGSAQQGKVPVVQCDDVTKLDVRNLIIRTGQRTFSFHNGIALNYDEPNEQEIDYSKPDWEGTVEKDRVIQPAPNVVVRFLLIHNSHVTGSGWRFHLTGFRCSGGKVQEVFHREGLSLKVDRLDSTGVGVSLNVIPGKPIRRRWAYTWDQDRSEYVLSSTELSPR